jgi:hypothetical protein
LPRDSSVAAGVSQPIVAARAMAGSRCRRRLCGDVFVEWRHARARSEALEVAEVAEVAEVLEAFRCTRRMPLRTCAAHRQIECAASRHLIGVARRRHDIVAAFSINGRAALQFAR